VPNGVNQITLTSDEALRKHGILPPREPTPPSPSPPPSPTLDDILEELTSRELRELGEDAQDDAVERRFAQHRAQRLVDERMEAQRKRFGTVIPIGRDDYTREVTESSMQDEPGDVEARGTGVVCFLYKDGYVSCSSPWTLVSSMYALYDSIPRSDRAHVHVRTLATRHPRTKFVSIVGDKCIPDLPDSRIPMFIVYRKSQIVTQITAWGLGQERTLEGGFIVVNINQKIGVDCTTTTELETLLIRSGAIIPPKRPPADSKDDLDDESDEGSSQMKSKSTWANYKNVRNTSKNGDSDSDFDL
jgi:hypothetical protein